VESLNYTKFKLHYTRIYFYIDTVFYLHGIYIASLYSITWLISKSILGSLLTCLFFVYNRYYLRHSNKLKLLYFSCIYREHSTRVEFSIPLRESFALPLIYFQTMMMCLYLKKNYDKIFEVKYRI
jgi:hypothetical protein